MSITLSLGLLFAAVGCATSSAPKHYSFATGNYSLHLPSTSNPIQDVTRPR